MSFDKNYPKRKDKRKPYRRAGRFCRACRTGGSCGWCRDDRTHNTEKRKEKASDE